MLGLSWSETALVAILAIIFLKPEDIPVIVRHCRNFMAKIRSLQGEVKHVFSDIAREFNLDDPIDGVRTELQQLASDVRPTIIDLEGKSQEVYEIPEELKPALAKRPERRLFNEEGE